MIELFLATLLIPHTLGLSVLLLSDGVCLLSIFLPQSQFMNPPDSSRQGEESADTDSLYAVYLLVGGVTVARYTGMYVRAV